MSIIKTPLADEDLKDIYRYSLESFGEEQAEKYYDGLEEKFLAILNKTAHSTDWSDARPGMRRVNYESHAIFYRRDTDDDVIIVRVLHQQLDLFRHLGG